MLRSSVVAVAASLALSACSSGGTSSTSLGATPVGATAAQSTLLGVALDTDVAVQSHSASLDRSDDTVRAYAQNFHLRSRDEYRKDGDFRRIRYGKPRIKYHPTRNYSIPLTITTVAGQETGTGTATFSGADVEESVITRTFTITDVELNNSVFGIFSTDDVGQTVTGVPREFLEIHAYAAGTAASALPNNADYTGRFLANVISDGGTDAVQFDLPANLNVNFLGGLMTGTIGAVAAPDIVLTGTVSGVAMDGIATVNSGAVTLSNGSTGNFSGSFYGAGASEAAGTLGISDKSGAINHEMVGAFGVTKN